MLIKNQSMLWTSYAHQDASTTLLMTTVMPKHSNCPKISTNLLKIVKIIMIFLKKSEKLEN